MDLKRNAENSRTLSKGMGTRATSDDVQIHSPQPRRPIDLKGLGVAGRGHGSAVSSTSSKTVDEPTVVSGDGNGASVPQKPLRGNGKLPKRPPIPRWDENGWQYAGGEGVPFKLGMTSWVNMT